MENKFDIKYERKSLSPKILLYGLSLLALGVLLFLLAYATDARRASFNMNIVYMYILSLGLGSLFFVALEYLANADWSVPFRRIAEILGALLFVAPLLAIPLAFDMHGLFHWTHEEALAVDRALATKAPYLNVGFFLIRSAIAFVLAGTFYFLIARRSFKQDASPRGDFRRKATRWSAIFMPIFAIATSIFAIDWMMSLEPHWYSTIFAVYYFSGTFLAALALLTIFVVPLSEKGYLGGLINKDHYYNFGAMMFAFVNFWAYIAFSQYMLMWYANLPEETFWFLNRWNGSWSAISLGLIFIHFIVPYSVLLSQPSKSAPGTLKFMAAWILVAHYYDLYWIIMPTYSPKGAALSWMEFIGPVLIAGIVLTTFALVARRRNLLPVGDEKLPRGLNFHL
ncbi:MAG: quinol:cytochrome C oxidoreductase [Chloroflexota bacterium]